MPGTSSHRCPVSSEKYELEKRREIWAGGMDSSVLKVRGHIGGLDYPGNQWGRQARKELGGLAARKTEGAEGERRWRHPRERKGKQKGL